MKKRICLLAFTALSMFCMAQSIPTFHRFFDHNHKYDIASSIIVDEDSFVFVESNFDLNTYQSAVFIKTDEQGNEAYRNTIFSPLSIYTLGYSSSFCDTKRGSYILGGGKVNYSNNNKGEGYLYKLDKQLDTVFVKSYSSGNASIFFQSKLLSDGSYLLAGHNGDTAAPGVGNAWLVKTDTNGTVLWQKVLVANNLGYPSITPFNGGFYMVWELKNYLATGQDDSIIIVRKYDNDGNIKWDKNFGVPGNYNVASYVGALADGGGIISVRLDTTVGTNHTGRNKPIVIYRFDSSGNTLWQKYIPANVLYPFNIINIIQTHNSDILLSGNIYQSNNTIAGYLLRMDLNGNFLWSQHYSGNPNPIYPCEIYDIAETPDSGIVTVGYGINPTDTNQDAWLMKVDANGCINGVCPPLIHTGIDDPVAEADRFLLFPNPTNTQFTVAVTETSYFKGYKGLVFSLYDLTGREVMNTTLSEQASTYPVADYSAGVYLWQISEGDRRLSNGKLVVTH